MIFQLVAEVNGSEAFGTTTMISKGIEKCQWRYKTPKLSFCFASAFEFPHASNGSISFLFLRRKVKEHRIEQVATIADTASPTNNATICDLLYLETFALYYAQIASVEFIILLLCESIVYIQIKLPIQGNNSPLIDLEQQLHVFHPNK